MPDDACRWPLQQKRHQTPALATAFGHLWWFSRFPLQEALEIKSSPLKKLHYPQHHGNASVSRCKCTHTRKGLNSAFLEVRLHSWVAMAHYHGWVDVTCFSSLQLTAASQRPQSGLKGYLASQPDWIPTQLSQLKCDKWVFFRITKIKAAHGINNALKHTGKEPFDQGSQLEVWVGIKTAHHSYG